MYQHLKSTSLMIVFSGFCLPDNCHFLQSGDGCRWREHSWTRHVHLSYPCIGLLSCNSLLLVCFSFCMSPLCWFPSCEHLWFALGSFLMVLLNGCLRCFTAHSHPSIGEAPDILIQMSLQLLVVGIYTMLTIPLVEALWAPGTIAP